MRSIPSWLLDLVAILTISLSVAFYAMYRQCLLEVLFLIFIEIYVWIYEKKKRAKAKRDPEKSN